MKDAPFMLIHKALLGSLLAPILALSCLQKDAIASTQITTDQQAADTTGNMICELPKASRRRIDNIIVRRLKRSHVPGYALTIVKGGRTIFQRGYGKADIASGQPITSDTIFGIASITKTFTAVEVLHLVDQGKLKLDDTIDKYLDNLPDQWKKLSIRQLITMTAGLQAGLGANEQAWPSELKILQGQPLLSRPGTAYSYSNPSYRLLGDIIERVEHRPYMDVINDFIIHPLDLQSTGKLSDFTGSSMMATAYGDNHTNGKSHPIDYKSEDISFSSGMLAASSKDLVSYGQALLDGKFVSPHSYLRMWKSRDVLPSGNKPDWSYGWFSALDGKTRQLKVWMNGGDPGVTSTLMLVPEQDLIIVALSNKWSDDLYRLPHKVAQTVLSREPGIQVAVTRKAFQ